MEGLSARVRSVIEAMLASKLPERVVLVSDLAGTGKSTVLRRVAFDLARAGVVVLNCSALSRIDARATAEAIDLIDPPLVIVVDDFADQVSSIAALINTMEKKDVIFVGAERSYRLRHIVQSLGIISHRKLEGGELTLAEAEQLIGVYLKHGFVGSAEAAKSPKTFAMRIVKEPIAAACCHILNDMRPLDGIVESTFQAAAPIDRNRFLISALAQFCFAGGVRFAVLAAAVGRDGWDAQFLMEHPLPLTYSDRAEDFIVPLNATLAERTLLRAPADDVDRAFEKLARGIAPRVNRDAIRNRAPEARLARRLFDYEDVIKRFLGARAGAFYAKVQPMWQWNSRYWEQVALFYLSRFRSEGDASLLQQALQHSRHAVAIELHPFTLTTLGKVLFAQMNAPGISRVDVFGEALSVLDQAIEIETARGRTSLHAYVTLFRGSLEYVRNGGNTTSDQIGVLKALMDKASRFFSHDRELSDLTNQLAQEL